jgi:RNA polymerase sigma factor (sigma-70 family)
MMHVASSLARHLTGLFDSRADCELLGAFLSERNENAFAELVRRHGPLVWSACRRLLPDLADAEDAFQASFLVLVRRAHRLRDRSTLAPWLYQVAVWTARNIRRRNARMLARRGPLSSEVADPSVKPQAVDLQADIDAALLSLPEKYRTPLVLCHLQGWTRREAAARLGCPEGTLSSLLARGLDRLRIKLKGHDPAKLLSIGLPTVPLVLTNATIKAAAGVHLAAACLVASTASQLAEGVIRMFWVKKATAASFALIAVFGFGMGLGVSVNRMPGAAAGDGPGAATGDIELVDATVAGDIDIDVATLSLAASEAVLHSAEQALKLANDKVEIARKTGDKRAIEQHLEILARIQSQVEDAKKNRDSVKGRLLLATKKQKNAVKESDEVQKLRARLENVRRSLDEHRAKLEVGKQALALAAQQNNQKARDEAGRVVEAAHAALLELQKQEAELRAKLADLDIVEAEKALMLRSRQTLLEAEAQKNAEDLKKIEAQMEQLKAQEAALRAEVALLAAQRDQTRLKMEALKKKTAEGVKQPAEGGKSYLELTITPKDAAWPFTIREFDSNGKGGGRVSFENPAVLSRYLGRAGKDATAPRDVRLSLPGDLKYETLVSVLEACQAAGFKTPTILKLGEQKSEAGPVKPRYDELIWRYSESYRSRPGERK